MRRVMANRRVAVMGSFVADLTFRAGRLPAWGETLMGDSFQMGPGGKGSNQAVAAARAGADVSFISKLGRDAFGEMARSMFREEGIDTRHLVNADSATGAAAILVDSLTGENSIIVVPGACFTLTSEEVDAAKETIAGAAIFVTQLELALPTVEHGLKLARALGVRTILNPAPGCKLPESIFQYCDYLTPNESETEMLTGVAVRTLVDAERAANMLLRWGVGNVVITLGTQGAFVKNGAMQAHVAAFDAGPVVETTGAGDAFNGGLALALAEERELVQAVRFGCAVAGISVTRRGTAPSMPMRSDVDELMKG